MTRSNPTQDSLAIPFLTNLGLIAVLFADLNFLPILPLLSCTYPIAEKLAIAFCVSLIVQFFWFSKFRRNARFWIAGVDIGLALLSLWLGTYSISPLGFSNGRIPFAQGFALTRSMRADLQVASGSTVQLANGSTAAIRPMTLPVNENCIWQSSNNGKFDDTESCNIAYIPPANSSFDIVKVLIRPSCNLPEAREELKVVVLP